MKGGNVLYYGDNLEILRGRDQHGQPYIDDESVDLVYLDPPFNSNKNYNVLFADRQGSRSAAQVKAFEDTWRWDQAAEAAYVEVVEGGGKVSEAMRAFRTFLGENDMMAYLAMMAPRLVELRRVLKQTGSIYLHCDPTASHYLKMLMDAVFGPKHFQNEIVWYYKGAGISPSRWGSRHDILLWYGKSERPYFNPDPVRDEYAETTKERFSHYIGNVRGGHDFGVQELNPKGKHPDDVWQIPILAPSARERLGYPTQKPEPLLERIILSSSKEGDVVLDPFCGCGTTIAVAQRLKRHWIGIDITHLAIALMKHRLEDAFGESAKYKVVGEPVDLEGARTLAADDPYQFQWWALGLLRARPVEQKKGADRGIDGRLLFHDEGPSGKTKQIIFSVKAGKVSAPHVRDLVGVLNREKAEFGVLISMEEPTREMRKEAAAAGFYKWAFNGQDFPRVQLLTIKEILDKKKIDYPGVSANVTFKQAPKAAQAAPAHPSLFDVGSEPIGRPARPARSAEIARPASPARRRPKRK